MRTPKKIITAVISTTVAVTTFAYLTVPYFMGQQVHENNMQTMNIEKEADRIAHGNGVWTTPEGTIESGVKASKRYLDSVSGTLSKNMAQTVHLTGYYRTLFGSDVAIASCMATIKDVSKFPKSVSLEWAGKPDYNDYYAVELAVRWSDASGRPHLDYYNCSGNGAIDGEWLMYN